MPLLAKQTDASIEPTPKGVYPAGARSIPFAQSREAGMLRAFFWLLAYLPGKVSVQ